MDCELERLGAAPGQSEEKDRGAFTCHRSSKAQGLMHFEGKRGGREPGPSYPRPVDVGVLKSSGAIFCSVLVAFLRTETSGSSRARRSGSTATRDCSSYFSSISAAVARTPGLALVRLLTSTGR